MHINTTNKLRPELVSIQGLNPFMMHNSSARGIMFGSHLSQHLTLDNPDLKPIVGSIDYEFAKYTFAARMPEDGRIVKLIPRFRPTDAKNAVMFNPETLVIYQKDSTGEYDCFVIPYYITMHQYFGFKTKPTDAMNMLRPGSFIAKDTVFADTPGVKEDGSYAFGKVLNSAFYTSPSVSEDGVIVSEDVLDMFKFRMYHTRVINFGSKRFPLNLYGKDGEYKPFPDIGEFIADHGMLMCTREYSDDYTFIDMSVNATQRVDYYFDKPVYAAGPGGRVVDIEVLSNNTDSNKLPTQMKAQLDRYKSSCMRYHESIVEAEKALRLEWHRTYGNYNLPIGPRFQRQVVESMAIINFEAEKLNLNLNHRMEPLDEYRVKITLEYVSPLNKGYKLTCLNGGKQYHASLASNSKRNLF